MNDGGPYGPGGVTSPLHLKEEEEQRECVSCVVCDIQGHGSTESYV